MSNFKDELMTALHDAVGYFNEDNDPNGAVVKSAKEHDFNAEQSMRLMETFNTARTIYHFKTASDRTTEFPLANREAVLGALFGEPAELKRAEVADIDYSEYDRPVRQYVEPVKPVEQEEKQAGESISLDAVSRQASKAITLQRQLVKSAADESRVAGSQAAETLRKLAGMVSSGNPSTNQDQLARLMVSFGRNHEYTPVITKLAEFIHRKDMPAEAQIVKYSRQAVIDDSDLDQHIDLIKDAKYWMETEAEMEAVSTQLKKEADAFEAEYLEAISPTFPEKKAGDVSDLLILKNAASDITTSQKYKATNIFGEPVDVEEKSGPGIGTSSEGEGVIDSISNLAGTSMKAPVGKFLETGVERAFTAPMEQANKALSERLKNVQRQIMLQDLLTNDPVLADEAPENVVEAYNSILQLAPEVAANKEIVRAILRQTVHSVAISPYDADVWTKLEQNIRNIKGKGAHPQVHK